MRTLLLIFACKRPKYADTGESKTVNFADVLFSVTIECVWAYEKLVFKNPHLCFIENINFLEFKKYGIFSKFFFTSEPSFKIMT